jgi:pyruvate/2-oxoglutarate dehydrogenase complex dihydrolipoamide acyltransferase (E2) component
LKVFIWQADLIYMNQNTTKTLDLITPDLGDTDKIELLKWYVKEGDLIAVGQEMLELVTDKASFPVEAPLPGKLIKIIKISGSIVKKGESLGLMEI